MTENELNMQYLNWMYQLVSDNSLEKSYYRLFCLLHNTTFIYLINMDINRHDDGIDLRYRFGTQFGYSDSFIAKRLDRYPCSVLEMMIALAIRLEEHIMDDPDIGDRTSRWFWEMIMNLGLSDMHDKNFNRDYVNEIIQRFLYRKYERNGNGGLFTVENCEEDLRDVEIWYQACWYLDSLG